MSPITSNVERPIAPVGFDPLSPVYNEEPHEFWYANAGDQRVLFYEPMNCWIVVGRDEMASVLIDTNNFSSHMYQAVPPTEALRERLPEETLAIAPRLMDIQFINTDPPEHSVQRRDIQRVFTARAVAEAEGEIRRKITALIDSFIADGSVEIMEKYAHASTIAVISGFIGMPDELIPHLPRWIGNFFSLMAPIGADLQIPDDVLEANYRGFAEAYGEIKEFLAERRANPKDDLISRMITSTRADGSPSMTDDQIITHTIELFSAGSDTTANLIGNAIRWVAERPELRKELAADPALWANVVEESLRRSGIVNTLGRVTTADVELGGVTIPAGSLTLVIPAAAGSDSRTFENALEFDPHRPDLDSHIAFGAGRHMCPGNALARLEARIALEELFTRIPDLTLTDETVEHTAAMTVRNIVSLNASWTV